ncbi:CheY-specific phosphatase CheX [Microbacterium resistens]|uniref:CheY-specific phosphatase CheX n=1 Tax=Microbacterium resistens TaxID=156977 RepID=A0ABU1SF94_9MICO|nr:CheY-specific phosphatase CheX [Microbacterium resistens]
MLSFIVVPLLASIVAVITGHMALGQTKRDPRLGGRGLAITGLVLGYIGVAGLIFVIVTLIISILLFGTVALTAIPFAQ